MQLAIAKILCGAFLAASLVYVSASSGFGQNANADFLSYMARASDLLQQDPARSLDCFNKYIPLINEIANKYETDFKACLNESEAASAKADEATLEQRNELANAAEASCALLQQCQENEVVEGIFQCYIDGGSANIQTMYTINANASQELAALREQYYLIKNSEYKCTNETKRVYERKSSAAYAGLNNCILGKEEPVTKEPSTTSASTTEQPIVTTTAVPETSENPTTSTIIPETTEKAPEETTTESQEGSTAGSSEAPNYTTSDSPIVTETSEAIPEGSTTASPVVSEDYY